MDLWKVVLAALLAFAARPALAHCGTCGSGEHAAHAEPAKKAVVPASAGNVQKGVRTIELTVTEDGFTPAQVTAKQGETVKLAVTRKVERTCATDIVMKDFGVNQPLPLEKTVVVTVKPEKKGTYRFACAHGHIAGDLVVQ
jgi:plastocyanin domain-containing protein